MRVRFTETALAELTEIHAYIAERNQSAARAVISRIQKVIDRVGEFPEMASAVDKSSVRVFPVPPFPFLVFYTVGREEVTIRNVRYAGRMRP
jgi:addiction module RelE/StbE family toxin